MKNSLLVILLVFYLSACNEDFLAIPSETSLSTSIFFKTEADFKQAVNGAYAPLRTIYDGANGVWAMGEMRSDNTHYALNPNFRATIDQEGIADFVNDAANAISTLHYVTNYQIIARANQILGPIDEVSFDEASKNNLKGQAYFLRALSYFNLVQFFGKIPLHTKPATNRAETALPLSNVEEVYAQIIADAKEAANLLPLKSKQEAGRATSGAAKTLLANVYMVQKKWAEAEAVLKEVVNSGEYLLLPNYADAFSTANKNSKESVFEVQYREGTDGFASNFIYSWLPAPITAAQVASITKTTNPQAITTEGFNIPTPDIIAAYEAGDLRKSASIATATIGTGDFPYIKKLLQPHTQHGVTGTNWPVYRYAETLLLLAEALNEGNKPGEAVVYLNQVRARAGLAATTAASQADLRVAILQERRVELAFENKRWLDLVRTGNAPTVMAAYGARVKAAPQKYYYPNGLAPAPAAYTNIQQLFPLPASEALLSPYF